MALLRCDFFSDVLEVSTSMTVLLPQQTAAQVGMSGQRGDEESPVLYLLHGLSDDDTIWTRRTSIERYVAPLGLAVVMPQAARSFYADMAYGGRYWTFLSEELPEVVQSFFRVSRAREDTFVAGLSMGGYGAIKWGLRQPHRFAAAASLSGALDIASLQSVDLPLRPTLWSTVFGDRLLGGSDDDPMELLSRSAASADPQPSLFVCCGTDDRVYEGNVRFAERARSLGVPLTAQFDRAEHEWGYWDRKIQDVLAWLPLRRPR